MRLMRLIVVVLAITLVGFGGVAYAADIQTSETVTVASGETIEDDLFASATTIRIDGTVAGDAYVAGEQVTITGTVEGDVFAAAQSINVSGSVGSIRAASQSVNFSGATVDGGVTYFGNTYSSNQQTRVNDGILFFGNTGTFAGDIAHGITAFAQTVVVPGTIGTDSTITSETFRVTESATVNGPVTHRSATEPEIAPGAQIDGEIIREDRPQEMQFTSGLENAAFLFSLWSFIAALVTGAVLLLIVRKPFSETANTVMKRPWASLGWGVIALAILGPLLLLLLLTVVGIPLAIILLGLALAALYISKFVVGIALGKVVLSWVNHSRRPRLFESFFIGLLILYILHFIPFISFLVSLLVAILGVGAILLYATSAIRAQHR